MKRIIICCLLFTLLGGVVATHDADAQIRKSRRSKQLRNNTKRITGYSGGAISFSKRKRYNSIGVSINTINYLGDLTPADSKLSFDFGFTRPSFSLHYQRRIHPRISIRGMYTWGRLRGDDFESADLEDPNARFRYTRNLQFRNDIHELSAMGIFDLFQNSGSFNTRVPFNVFLSVGLAGFYHNPMGQVPEFNVNHPAYDAVNPENSGGGARFPNAGEWVALEPLGTEGQKSDNLDVDEYSKIQIAIPIGIGIRAKLNSFLDFEFEASYRHLFTDHIDDVGGDYVDLGAISDPLGRALSDRSREHVAVESGEARDLAAIAGFTEPFTYTSEYDGNDYTVFRGYGVDGPGNIRGSSNNDFYVLMQFRILYILGGNVKRAKFR